MYSHFPSPFSTKLARNSTGARNSVSRELYQTCDIRVEKASGWPSQNSESGAATATPTTAIAPSPSASVREGTRYRKSSQTPNTASTTGKTRPLKYV